MIEATVKGHVTLRSRMFKYASAHKHFDVSRKLEELIFRIYAALLRKGDVAVDIGAHTGYHARLMSDLVGPTGLVLAIEPNTSLRERLDAHIQGRQNVVIIHKVLSDSEKDAIFHCVSGQKSSRSGLALWDKEISEAEYEKQLVKTATLDSLYEFRQLSFIKIDAEGTDLACLKGGKRTIEDFRPYIVVEWNQTSYQVHGYRSQDLRDFSSSVGYRIFNTFGDDLSNRELYERYSTKFSDFFLVPSERESDFCRNTREGILLTISRIEREIMEIPV